MFHNSLPFFSLSHHVLNIVAKLEIMTNINRRWGGQPRGDERSHLNGDGDREDTLSKHTSAHTVPVRSFNLLFVFLFHLARSKATEHIPLFLFRYPSLLSRFFR